MDLANVANLAEIVGTAMVVISLIYVGVQIRKNTQATKLTTAQNVSQDLRSALSFIVSESEFATIHLRGIRNVEELTPDEKHRFYAFVNLFLRTVENAYYQNKTGVLDPYVWEAVTANVGLMAKTSGYRAFWGDRQQYFSKEFQEFYAGMPTPDPSLAVEPYRDDAEGA